MHEGSRARRALYVWVERLLVRRVSSVGAVSQYEAAAATNVAHAPRVVVVPNGIPELDTPPGAPSGRETRRPRVVTLGRIAPQRRPVESARILAGLADLADPEWVGGGGRGGVPRTAVTDQGVALSGWLSHREAMERLAAATAYLHWSAWDGCPLSVLEAMAYDVVVVGSDIAPLRELLGPAQLCSTEEQAVATLRRVLTDASFRQRLLDEQRRRRAGAGAGRMVDEWRAVYRAIRAA